MISTTTPAGMPDWVAARYRLESIVAPAPSEKVFVFVGRSLSTALFVKVSSTLSLML